MNVKDLIIDSIEPEPKDYDRAVGLSLVSNEYIPCSNKAKRMANSISDPRKMVRRSKAVVGAWGRDDYKNGSWHENAWIPFEQGLRRIGFTEDQIKEISRFEIDEELLK
jgi:hypothetical protein